ncbi:MAG: TonB-dependent receptor, partial [Haliea sp.]
AYAKHTERGALETASGGDAGDDGEQSQIGGRIDWQRSQVDQFTLQGDAYTGDFGQRLFQPSLTPPGMINISDTGDKHGHNLLIRWQRQLNADNDFTLQAYYDHYERDSLLSGESASSWDIDFQHNKRLHERLDILWGLGYRHQDIDLEERFNTQFQDLDRALDTFSGFIQGDIELAERLRLTLGSKFEHNDFTGFEVQPSAHLLWAVHDNHSLWASVSRAVRAPNLVDDGLNNNFFITTNGLPLLFQTVGNPDVDAEELITYELGWRGQVRPDLAVDVAAFYNDYDKLVSSEFNPVPEFRTDPVPHLLFRSLTDNQLRGETYGLEASAEWQATDRWRLTASYTLLEMALRARPGSADLFTAALTEGSNPEQQFQVRSYLDLPHDLEFDMTLYWVDQLPAQNVDDYLRLDLHLGWQPTPDLQIGLFAQNLLDDRHTETNQFILSPTEVPRAIFGRLRLTW